MTFRQKTKIPKTLIYNPERETSQPTSAFHEGEDLKIKKKPVLAYFAFADIIRINRGGDFEKNIILCVENL